MTACSQLYPYVANNAEKTIFESYECGSDSGFTYAIKFGYQEVDLFPKHLIQLPEYTGPQRAHDSYEYDQGYYDTIIRKNGPLHAYIKTFANKFDEDINIIFPKSVQNIRVAVIDSEGAVNKIDNCVKIDNSDGTVVFINKKYFTGQITDCQLSESMPTEKVSIDWRFENYLEFDLNEIIVEKAVRN